MRATPFVFAAIFLATAVAHGHPDMEGQDSGIDGIGSLTDLSKEEAATRAGKMAEADFARNVYRILVVGKRPAKNASDDFLKEKYGILATPIAGCLVSDGIIGAQDGYNSAMKRLLNRKFGHDIFKEAEEASRR